MAATSISLNNHIPLEASSEPILIRNTIPSPETDRELITELSKNQEQSKNTKDCYMENFLGKTTHKFLRNEFPVLGFGLTSVLHCLIGLHKYFNFLPKSLGEFLDLNLFKATKFVKAINYFLKGAECLSVGRGMEGLFKLFLPLLFLKSKLENFFSFTGIISGLTMMEASQIPKTNKMPNNAQILGNIKNNVEATKLMYQEIFNRKNLDYNHLFFSGGNVKLIGSILGTIFENNGLLRRASALIRNGGSIAADISKFFQRDINWKISGSFFSMASIFDIWQNFIDNSDRRRAIAHLSIAAKTLANFFYLNITKARTDGTYKI